ncbi:MAG: hypothetical protein Q9227_008455 [Pyrenula ochraceoflavens]
MWMLPPNFLSVALEQTVFWQLDSDVSSSILQHFSRSSLGPPLRPDGDGPWSTFALRIGEPAQNIRVLPSTSQQQVWAVIPQGCPSFYGSDCANDRGWLFDNSTSKTWKNKGLYNLGAEDNLGLDSTAVFGFDTVGLGLQGTSGPTLPGQLVAGIATPTYWLGSLGVNPQSTNFTTFDDTVNSFMSNLKGNGSIPSLSFGYTAGAKYRLKGVPGSLVLGGYDQSLFAPNPIQFTFAEDSSRQLVVAVQNIRWTSSSASGGDLLPNSVLALIDSTVPNFYLPLEACQEFEKAFGLVYNATTSMYVVDDALHQNLTTLNPSVTFTLGNGLNGGETVSISLPYASFDLTMPSPPAQSTTRYFPLQRAANSTQYTLGRAFLQEAYLVVDWERATFSLAQTIFGDSIAEDIRTISSAWDHNSSHHLSVGVIAGIAAGIAVLFILITIIAVCLLFRRRKRRRLAAATAASGHQTSELEGDRLTGHARGPRELGEKHERVAAELQPGYRGGQEIKLRLEKECPELESTIAAKELPDRTEEIAMIANFVHELPGSEGYWPELDDTSEAARKKKGSNPSDTLDISPVKSEAQQEPSPKEENVVRKVKSFANFKQGITKPIVKPVRKSKSGTLEKKTRRGSTEKFSIDETSQTPRTTSLRVTQEKRRPERKSMEKRKIQPPVSLEPLPPKPPPKPYAGMTRGPSSTQLPGWI